MTPESRREQLISQEVGQELVVYDQQTHVAHRLNRTAAMVWRLADGKRSVADISKILHDAADAPDDEDVVRLALSELDKSGLLRQGLPKIDEAMTRRRLLSLGAALIPVVASIAVPSAVAAFTDPGSGSGGAPTISTISPEYGPVSGGTPVTVTGTNFDSNTVVTIGGQALVSPTLVSATEITGLTPASPAGRKDVVVTSLTGSSTATLAFAYLRERHANLQPGSRHI